MEYQEIALFEAVQLLVRENGAPDPAEEGPYERFTRWCEEHGYQELMTTDVHDPAYDGCDPLGRTILDAVEAYARANGDWPTPALSL